MYLNIKIEDMHPRNSDHIIPIANIKVRTGELIKALPFGYGIYNHHVTIEKYNNEIIQRICKLPEWEVVERFDIEFTSRTGVLERIHKILEEKSL